MLNKGMPKKTKIMPNKMNISNKLSPIKPTMMNIKSNFKNYAKKMSRKKK